MSRFYLVLLLLCSQSFWGQKQLAKLVAHADQQVLQQDYIEALDFYRQALVLEPTSVELLWKMAQTYQASKDYINGAKFYIKKHSHNLKKSSLNLPKINLPESIKRPRKKLVHAIGY
jgi:hypothetical protein